MEANMTKPAAFGVLNYKNRNNKRDHADSIQYRQYLSKWFRHNKYLYNRKCCNYGAVYFKVLRGFSRIQINVRSKDVEKHRTNVLSSSKGM